MTRTPTRSFTLSLIQVASFEQVVGRFSNHAPTTSPPGYLASNPKSVDYMVYRIDQQRVAFAINNQRRSTAGLPEDDRGALEPSRTAVIAGSMPPLNRSHREANLARVLCCERDLQVTADDEVETSSVSRQAPLNERTGLDWLPPEACRESGWGCDAKAI